MARKYTVAKRKRYVKRKRYARRGRLGVPSVSTHAYMRTLSLYGGAGGAVAAAGWQVTSNVNIVGNNDNIVLFEPVGAVTTPTISYCGWSYNCQLGDFPSFADFTNLYDTYRIDNFTLSFMPYQTGNVAVDTLGVQNNFAVILHYVHDFDDSATPANTVAGMDQLKQYASYKRVHLGNCMGKPISISIKRPARVTPAIVSAGTYTGAMVDRSKRYIDCGSTTVEHFGIKGIFEILGWTPPGLAQPQMYVKGEVKAHFTFKETR